MKRLFVIAFALVLASTIVVFGTPAVQAQDASVSVVDNAFQPSSVTINVGDTVTWTWEGSNPHTVTADDGSFASAQQTSGTFSQTFDTAGTFSYFCEVHPGIMTGTVTVNAGGGEPDDGAATPTTAAGIATPTVAAAQPTQAAPAPTSAAGGDVTAPSTGTGGPGDGGGPNTALLAAMLGIGSLAAGAGIFLVRRRA